MHYVQEVMNPTVRSKLDEALVALLERVKVEAAADNSSTARIWAHAAAELLGYPAKEEQRK